MKKGSHLKLSGKTIAAVNSVGVDIAGATTLGGSGAATIEGCAGKSITLSPKRKPEANSFLTIIGLGSGVATEKAGAGTGATATGACSLDGTTIGGKGIVGKDGITDGEDRLIPCLIFD
ncbi:MAG: hypothetical protein AAB723_00890, partial [Patescibacteria group bacterium]